MENIDKRLKRTNELSEIVKRILLRVSKLEQNPSGGGNVTLPISISDVTNLQTSLDDFIPITGTQTGKDLTGSIKIAATSDFYIYKETPNRFNLINFSGDSFNINSVDLNTSDEFNIGISPTALNLTLSSFGSLYFDEFGLDISMNNPSSRGIRSTLDYSNNITQYDYTQKIYVDKTVNTANSYSTTETPTGGTWINNSPIYRIVKLTANPNPAGIVVIILSRVVGSYTILEYTKV